MERLASIRRHNLRRTVPSEKWLEGIPCGNGHEGTMAFGPHDRLSISLDRMDLWSIGSKSMPLRLNAGCLELPSCSAKFEEGLDIVTAEAYRNSANCHYRWFVHATRRWICIAVNQTGGSFAFKWNPPELWTTRDIDGLNYAKLFLKEGDDCCLAGNVYAGLIDVRLYISGKIACAEFNIEKQTVFKIKIAAMTPNTFLPIERRGEHLHINSAAPFMLVVAIDNPVRQVCNELPDTAISYEQLLMEHSVWWEKYWNGSYLTLSAPAADRFWHMGRYLAGSAMREDSPCPVPLQAVWGESSPPWRGSYTWDLNVQSCYWPLPATGEARSIMPLARWYNEHLPKLQDVARTIFNRDGAVLPLNTDINGDYGSRPHHNLTCSVGSWVCHNLWQYYEFTGDRDYLRQYCVKPFTEHLKFMQASWIKLADGKYFLEKSESPELGMLNIPEHPCHNSAYDIAFGRFLADKYLTVKNILGLNDDNLSFFAADFLKHCPAYPECATMATNYYWAENPQIPEYIIEWPGLDTEMSHRHLSHLALVWPLGEYHSQSDPVMVRKLKNTMQRLQSRGFGSWESFSFGWASIVNSRIGWRKRYSLNMLDIMNRYLTMPFNGICINDDYFGYGLFNQTGPYGPGHLGAFTFESPMIAMTAVQEAVLHSANGKLVLGNGLHEEIEGHFSNLHVGGNRQISGTISNGNVTLAE